MKSLFFIIALMATSCGRNNAYVYPVKSTQTITYSEVHAVVNENSMVDIIWVIDNSGSMSSIQADIKVNTDKFMNEFIKNKLDWKMGIVSTDNENLKTFLGFDSLFDWKNPTPVDTFMNAVASLGTNGSGDEQTFDPLLTHLRDYPNFLRPKAFLIMIVVTDEPEHSHINSADDFLTKVRNLKGNPDLFKAYGALQAVDWGCVGGGDYFEYKGSRYERVIKETKGKVYSTCAGDFGLKLAELSKDIISTIISPVILLKARPITSTIKVTYKGEILPGGTQESGGLWIYDPENNSISFHNLDFVDFNVKNVEIFFDVDQG